MSWEYHGIYGFPTGSTSNSTRLTTVNNTSQDEPFNDITFVQTFKPSTYKSKSDGDYFLLGDTDYGVFLRVGSGTIKLYICNNSTEYGDLGDGWSISDSNIDYYEVALIIGVNDVEKHGTIFYYQRPTVPLSGNPYVLGYSSSTTNSTNPWEMFMHFKQTDRKWVANGGGCTFFSKRAGVLSSLESYQDDILIVSGGGGGGIMRKYSNNYNVQPWASGGDHAGGISGSNQKSGGQVGNRFGQGTSATYQSDGNGYSAGGGGWQGGDLCDYREGRPAGAGSGYIGNSILIAKKMVGYSVPTSSNANTYTESVETYATNPTVGQPKAGNGAARIKFSKQPLVLMDAYNNYHHNYVDMSNTGFVDGGSNTRWQYLSDGTFESYDATQSQSKCVWATKFKKGNATYMCAEIQRLNSWNYPDFGWGLYSTMPTAWGYPNGGTKGTVLKWLYDQDTGTKSTYVIYFDDIDANTEFYLGFYNNSKEVHITRWYVDAPLEVVQGGS